MSTEKREPKPEDIEEEEEEDLDEEELGSEVFDEDDYGDEDEDEGDEDEDEGEMYELLSDVLQTPDGDTLCGTLVRIADTLETQNKIMIKMLSALSSSQRGGR